MESSHTKSNVNDGSFFCSSVLRFYSCKLCVFIARHHVDSTFRKLLEEVAWLHLLVDKVLELWLIISDELEIEWTDFEDELQAFGPKIKQCNILVNATEPPIFIWVIGAA